LIQRPESRNRVKSALAKVSCRAGAHDSVVALSIYLTPTRKLAEDVKHIDIGVTIPKQFGQWIIDPTIVPVMPSPDQSQALNQTYDQVISYTYVNRNESGDAVGGVWIGSETGAPCHRRKCVIALRGFKYRI